MSTASDIYQPPKVSFWNDPKIRSALVQVIMVLVVGFFVYEIVDNTITNLTKRNISTGFGFLNKSAGFDLIQTLIAYSSESSYGRALVAGFLNTLLVSGLGIIFATILGFIIGIMRLSKNWLVSSIATLYIETIRNVPLLLQMFVWYGVVLKPLPGPRAGDQFQRHVFPVKSRPQHAGHNFWRRRLAGACRPGRRQSSAPLSCAAGRARARPQPDSLFPMC